MSRFNEVASVFVRCDHIASVIVTGITALPELLKCIACPIALPTTSDPAQSQSRSELFMLAKMDYNVITRRGTDAVAWGGAWERP